LRLVEVKGGLGSVLVIGRLLEELRRAGLLCNQILLAQPLQVITGEIGPGASDRRLRLLDQGLLQQLLLLDILDGRLGDGEISLRLIELCSVIIVDYVYQKIAGLDPLEVLHGNASDITRTLRGKRSDIGLKIGVVGALLHCRSHPPIPFARNENDESAGQDQDKQSDSDLAPWKGLARL